MKTGTYKHYKGGLYTVHGVVMHSETGEKMVLYSSDEYPELFSEYGNPTHFVRPYEMFNETIVVGGQKIKRFTCLED